MNDKFLTKEEAAEFLHVSPGTINAWVYKKKIPYRKHGNRVIFSEKALIEWSERHEVPEHPIWSKK